MREPNTIPTPAYAPFRVSHSGAPSTEARGGDTRLDAHREQAQGVECHRGFGDQPLRAGTHEKGLPQPTIASPEIECETQLTPAQGKPRDTGDAMIPPSLCMRIPFLPYRVYDEQPGIGGDHRPSQPRRHCASRCGLHPVLEKHAPGRHHPLGRIRWCFSCDR